MAVTSSESLIIGQQCPNFSLLSVDGQRYDNASLIENMVGLAIAFWCNHCPYVKAIEERFLALSKTFGTQKIQFVTICSNDPENHPEDAASELYKHWNDKNYEFPYLVDESQKVAHDFDARCTPDIFVFDRQLALYYHGQIDDSWKDPTLVKTHDLRNALERLIAGQPAPELQRPTIGCSIKWKKI